MKVIAGTIAHRGPASEIRSFLKAAARSTWQLTAWLTHSANATRYDGTVAVDATYAVLNAFGAALLRYEQPTKNRCVRCGSLRIQIVDYPESSTGDAVGFESCGFLDVEKPRDRIVATSDRLVRH